MTLRMRFFLIYLILVLGSCNEKVTNKDIIPPLGVSDWENRLVTQSNLDSLSSGQTYLSVYSEIYINTEKERIPLGATISIKNPNRNDTIFLTSAEYFETSGKLVRNYVKSPIYVAPMETIEIVIERLDKEGGSGANFLFDWRKEKQIFDPIFECLMLSSIGNRSFSFTTHGHNLVTDIP